eukprot:15467155-Alexandrium_andersonii.AAC.1
MERRPLLNCNRNRFVPWDARSSSREPLRARRPTICERAPLRCGGPAGTPGGPHDLVIGMSPSARS